MSTDRPKRFLPIAEVVARSSLSSATIWRHAGIDFPAPVPISAGRVAWLESDIDAWIERKAGASS